jgi:hypothetical protein
MGAEKNHLRLMESSELFLAVKTWPLDRGRRCRVADALAQRLFAGIFGTDN